MARAPAVHVRGLRELRAELRATHSKLPRAMRIANTHIAEVVASNVRDKASTHRRRVVAKSAPAIVGSGEQRAAKIAINKGTRYRFADGAFFGAKQFPQFEPWVGNQHEMPWPAGVNDEGPGRGPYALNPAIFESIPEIEDFYLNAFEDAVARAFPGGDSFGSTIEDAEIGALGRSVLGR